MNFLNFKMKIYRYPILKLTRPKIGSHLIDKKLLIYGVVSNICKVIHFFLAPLILSFD
jgi:hypothetical protein